VTVVVPVIEPLSSLILLYVTATEALAVIEALPPAISIPFAVTVPLAVILAEASAIEPPVADTIASANIAPLPNCVLVPIADTSAKPFITALPNTNAPLVVTVIVAVAFMLAADVLKRIPDADTVASAVICADASSVLPANELKGAWENELIPNNLFSFYISLFRLLEAELRLLTTI
jgi:hypothetical protein